ncbi:MAG TPA: DUF4234 domain-containing protein [Candidatus Sulfotelmatobacter sp.]|nr:DUF4234 domain-containing protein [Candidatus Sulfotelmatobacter sp.]
MKNRNPFLVLLFSIITLGIYYIYYLVSTKNEMKKLGAEIPTAWLLIVPIVWWYWFYKYAVGVDKVTNHEFSTGVSFVLLFFLGGIAGAIIQTGFNKVGSAAPAAAPVDPALDSLNSSLEDPAPADPSGVPPSSDPSPMPPSTDPGPSVVPPSDPGTPPSSDPTPIPTDPVPPSTDPSPMPPSSDPVPPVSPPSDPGSPPSSDPTPPASDPTTPPGPSIDGVTPPNLTPSAIKVQFS